MSFSKTTDQIRNRTKTETRRLGWDDLKPGDRFCAIEKGQGLKKGEHVKRLALLECVSNRSEPLDQIDAAAVAREWFPGIAPDEFVAMFCQLNRCPPMQPVNVIVFKYIKPEVFFLEPDHPVCLMCVSSLDREDDCPECGGGGFIFDPDEDDDEDDWCTECDGDPAGWFCPTCHTHWDYHELGYPEQEEGQ